MRGQLIVGILVAVMGWTLSSVQTAPPGMRRVLTVGIILDGEVRTHL